MKVQMIRQRAFIAVCIVFTTNAAAAATDDHAFPMDTNRVPPGYQALLARRLFSSSANYGRIVILPSGFVGETALSIDSHGVDGSARLTCAQAARSLWDPVFFHHPDMKLNLRVRIERCNAFLPEKAAKSLANVIEYLVRRSSAKTAHEWVALDGTDFELISPSAGMALVTPLSRGARIRAFLRIVQLLQRFCVSPEKERGEIVDSLYELAGVIVQ
jgi:hypothetical protein